MSGYSDSSVVNLALIQLKISESIMSLSDDDTDIARAARAVYPALLDEFLTATKWVPSTPTIKLNRVAEVNPPYPSFPYKFRLPTDELIKIESIVIGGDPFHVSDLYYGRRRADDRQLYVPSGNYLYFSEDTCYVQITKRITPSDMRGYMIIPFATLIASKLCYLLTGSTSREDFLRQTYKKELSNAIHKNIMEKSESQVDGDTISGRVV